jgi:hypothetical protein
MKVFQICGIGRERPEAMPHQWRCHQSSKSRRSHPAPNQVCGEIWRRSPRTPAVITTNSQLAPALARQQMAEMVAVITTIRPMPALARHQTAKEPAIIASAAIIQPTQCQPWQGIKWQKVKRSRLRWDPILKDSKTTQSIHPAWKRKFVSAWKQKFVSIQGTQLIKKGISISGDGY